MTKMKEKYLFLFCSRHAMTPGQEQLAADQGILLKQWKDVDAFEGDFQSLLTIARGVVVVHPVAALRAIGAGLHVGVFKNSNRAAEGEPQFKVDSLWLYPAGFGAPCAYPTMTTEQLTDIQWRARLERGNPANP